MNHLNNFAIYIHWPFCAAKCPYCDFNSHVRDNIAQDIWLKAYLSEIKHYSTHQGNLRSIFFGGGTPSLMQPYLIEAMLEEIDKYWSISDIEITLEANPTSSEINKFKAFKQSGINRISIGIQSLDNSDLTFLGRKHNADEGIKAIHMAGEVFENFSFDLIYARPNQSLAAWERELRQALSYHSPHISLYQLTIEEGTNFYHQYHHAKAFEIPDQDLAAEMFELTNEMMNQHDMHSYEISNHAKAGYESRHNLIYWRGEEYLGIGAGAHGRLWKEQKKYETMNHKSPEKWLQQVEQMGHGLEHIKEQNRGDIAAERLMLGLRINEGIEIAEYIDMKKLQELERLHLIEVVGDRVRLTKQGRLLQTSIAGELLHADYA